MRLLYPPQAQRLAKTLHRAGPRVHATRRSAPVNLVRDGVLRDDRAGRDKAAFSGRHAAADDGVQPDEASRSDPDITAEDRARGDETVIADRHVMGDVAAAAQDGVRSDGCEGLYDGAVVDHDISADGEVGPGHRARREAAMK